MDQLTGPLTFTAFTPAGPAQVWQALTDSASHRCFLYGLALRSQWTAGADICAADGARAAVTGQVLCVRPEERLSYLLRSSDDDPAVYLTWLIRPCSGGSIVKLQIDETDAAQGRHDAEETWLPVLAGLQRALAG